MDFYIEQIHDVIPLNSLRNEWIDGVRFLRVRVLDTNGLTDAFVNGVEVAWEILNEVEVRLTLPRILQEADIVEVLLLAWLFGERKQSQLRPRLVGGRSIVGLQEAIQLFLKWLFTTPGSDAIDDEGGGGWSRILAGATSTEDVLPALVEGIQRTLVFVKKLQSADNIPDSTLIQNIELLGAALVGSRFRVSFRFQTKERIFQTQVGL